MKLTKVITRIVPVLLVVGLFVAVSAGPANAGVRTPRNCASYYDGDWKLDVCSGGYYVDGTHDRAVVDMHTYHWSEYCGCWLDSQSQSITMNESYVYYGHPYQVFPLFHWGMDDGIQCRVNDPAGSVNCGITNAVRVTFYSKAFTASVTELYANRVTRVSWRDASGHAHYVNPYLWSPAF